MYVYLNKNLQPGNLYKKMVELCVCVCVFVCVCLCVCVFLMTLFEWTTSVYG